MASVNKVIDEYTEKAFWSKVDVTDTTKDCWHWRGAKKNKGYGNLRVNGVDWIAHRFAFILANGDIPNGLLVCHICDQPSCCNPYHLMLGTNKSNYVDMVIKNRQGYTKNRAFGLRNFNSKLTWEQVCEVRKKYATKEVTQKQLGKLYGVTQTAIGYIVRFKTRKEA